MIPRQSGHAHTMRHLFSPVGLEALRAVLERSPLVAFDFDGTLAPIVRRPEDARVPLSVSHRLRRLAQRLPVAVVSGRSLADLSERIAFQSHYLVGNHGAEMRPGEPVPGQEDLDALRALLQPLQPDLHALGVVVEDKGMSLALHYRLARRPDLALAKIRATLRPFQARLRTFAGKMVENVTAAGAPDKADAMSLLVRHCSARCAVFFGDDVNDEPVFASAPDDWLTVRVGQDDRHSGADFFIHHPGEMVAVLERMLGQLGDPGPGAHAAGAG